MKETELRIGNIVFDIDSQTEYVINPIDIFNVANSTIEIFKPIELTEEWLIKLGLLYNGHMYSNGSTLVVSPDLSWIGIYTDRMEDDAIFDCPKYVHQLQNLYFCLTGKELKLN